MHDVHNYVSECAVAVALKLDMDCQCHWVTQSHSRFRHVSPSREPWEIAKICETHGVIRETSNLIYPRMDLWVCRIFARLRSGRQTNIPCQPPLLAPSVTPRMWRTKDNDDSQAMPHCGGDRPLSSPRTRSRSTFLHVWINDVWVRSHYFFHYYYLAVVFARIFLGT